MKDKNLNMEFIEVFRINKDTKEKLMWLLEFRGDKYDNKSHLFRCALIKLFNEEKKNG